MTGLSLVGRTLAQYHITAHIGSGAMGAVYRARDTKLERDVAVKVLATAPVDAAEAGRRIRKEALALSQLNHPNIAAVYDFDVADDIAFVVLELVGGEDLGQRLRGGSLHEKDVLTIGLQAADGLQAAHAAGIVHRDLKPANIRVTPEGRVKILDFGLATRVTSADEAVHLPTQTAAVSVAGTIPYMAPEHLRGEAPDPRSDIYALCLVLYEMATGVRPFEGKSDVVLIDKILNTAAPPPREVNPEVSAGLEAILLKGLEKDPERRYQSARELHVDLERLRTPSTSRPMDPVPPRSRVRRSSWLAAAALVVLALGGAWLVWVAPNRGTALAFAARDFVLVTDFDNQTGEAVFDSSLATAFAVGLGQSAYANLVPRTRIDQALARMGRKDQPRISETLGREICMREGVKALVVPSIGRVGNRYLLSARLLDPQTGSEVRSYSEQADNADGVLDALGRIGESLRRDLGESLASIQSDSRPLPRVTTASLEALKSHADGAALWRKGQYREAVVHYQRAVDKDPDFAMAHSALGSAYLSFIFNDHALGKQHMDRALALADRTTERERMDLQATYEARLGDRLRARDLYAAYLFRYPDDAAMRFNFAGLLRELRRFDEAATEYKEVIRLSPLNASAYINLATAEMQAHHIKEGLAAYDEAFRLEPSWKAGSNLNHEYGFALVQAGRSNEARDVFALALKAPEERPRGLRSLALLDLLEGRYRDAEPRLVEAAQLNEGLKRWLSAGRDLFFLSQLRQGLNDRRGELAYLDRATALYERSAARGFLVRTGIAYARANELARAERVLKVVRSLPTTGEVADPSDVALLEGEILIARGQMAEGLARLEQAHSQIGAATEQTSEALAHAHERAGNVEKAVAAYEAFEGQFALGWEPQHPWLAAHYHLAALQRQRGQTTAARTALQRLLTLWQHADDNLPLLQRARKLAEELSP